MSTILVTGCSHTAGDELSHQFVFADYDEFLLNAKTHSQEHNYMTMRKKQILYLLKNYQNKKFESYIGNNFKKASSIANRYFRFVDRKFAWPVVLQKLLPNCKVINVARSGNSWKQNVQVTLSYMKKYDDLIVVHQVPNIYRTYIKHGNRKHKIIGLNDLEYLKKLHQGNVERIKTFDELAIKYQNLVHRDISHDYFRKATSRFTNYLQKHTGKSTKHLFILTHSDQAYLFPSDDIIIDNLSEIQQNYIQGPQGHVVDTNFTKKIANTVAWYLQKTFDIC